MKVPFLFLEALVIGFSIALPLGPIGLLCVGRTLERGFWAGLASGLGAATADGFYGFVAASGFAAVASRLVAFERPLAGGGGLFLAFLGAGFLRHRPPVTKGGDGPSRGPAADFLSAFGLTLTNPMTLLSFAALFSALGALGGGAFPQVVVGGVFVGSALWWLILAGTTALLRERLPQGLFSLLQKGAGLALLGFGLWIIGTRFLFA